MKGPRAATWIRWSYVLPRLAILLLIFAGFRYGLDGALRWAIVSSGEASLGAKVEIGELTTALREGKVRLSSVAAANPAKPMRNLFQAEQLDLQIDLTSLLHKRLVVTDGQISGIVFDGTRETSGALDSEPSDPADEEGPSLLAPLADVALDRGADWVDGVAGRVEQDLASQLKSPPLLKELEAKWPAKLRTLETDVDALKASGQRLEQNFREVRANPLRNLGKLEQLQVDLMRANEEVRRVTGQINRLPQEVQSDRQAVDLARQQDEAFLRKQLDFAELDGEQLSYYLLGEQADGYLGTALSWLAAARDLIPSNKTHAPDDALRGVDFDFSRVARPTWLIERVRLDGTASIGSEPLEWVGLLTDVAADPTLHSKPTELRLQGSGAVGVEAVVQLDRRGGEPLDTLHLECPHLALPQRTLGRPEKLAVTLPPSVGAVIADVRLAGDQLTGTIRLHQSQFKLQPSLHALPDQELVAAVAAALAPIDRFEAEVVLGGTLKRPEWKLSSDLGTQVAGGMNQAVKTYMKQRQDRLLAKVQAVVDEQFATIERQQQAVQEKLLAKLGENQKLLAALFPSTGEGAPGIGGVSFPMIGRGLTDRILK